MSRTAIDFYNCGITHLDLGDHARATADFTDAIRLNPRLAVAFDNRGLAYSAQGDNARAEAVYREAIRLDPSLAQ